MFIISRKIENIYSTHQNIRYANNITPSLLTKQCNSRNHIQFAQPYGKHFSSLDYLKRQLLCFSLGYRNTTYVSYSALGNVSQIGIVSCFGLPDVWRHASGRSGGRFQMSYGFQAWRGLRARFCRSRVCEICLWLCGSWKYSCVGRATKEIVERSRRRPFCILGRRVRFRREIWNFNGIMLGWFVWILCLYTFR